MRSVIIASIVLQAALGASIVDVSCPDSCTCTRKDGLLEASCGSYEFIKKVLPKQQASIVRLNINNSSLLNVDLKLKYLKQIEFLDLSDNNIAALPIQFPYLPKLGSLNLSKNHLKDFTFSQFPKNIQEIDLSRNYITKFPKDWSALKQLETIYLNDNPIDCDCDNVLTYEEILGDGITIPKELTCNSPKKFQGHTVSSINCTLMKDNFLNLMLGDDAGSGEEETEAEPSAFDREELINAQGVTENPDEMFEGSGDEGSGDIPILPIAETPKACHFNCSTPSPVGRNDEKDASPLPSIHEQAKIVWDDLLNPEEEHTVPPSPETTLPTKEEPIEINETSDKLRVSEVETFPTNDTVVGEMERASLHNSNSLSAYIVCGLLVAFVALILLYYVNKKRAQRRVRRRNKGNENGFGEEMKPLGKSAEIGKIEQPNSKLPERAPLLNGQNRKMNGDGLLKPVDDEHFNDVDLRSKEDDYLTPQPERVTIKAGELTDSIPKTPLLIHRQVNSDGQVVTTAVN